jgi:microcystin-dependent protein
MSEPFIGQITLFAGNFAPRGWAFCQGQLLSISQNTALFSILGTTYGGNGQTTFGLPDLRGRVPVQQGQGPGLSSYDLGQMSGQESVTLLSTQMPQHTHIAQASTGDGSAVATGAFWASPTDSTRGAGLGYTPTSDTTMSPSAIGLAGGNQPFPILQPLLGLNFIIALEGIFPSRN